MLIAAATIACTAGGPGVHPEVPELEGRFALAYRASLVLADGPESTLELEATLDLAPGAWALREVTCSAPHGCEALAVVVGRRTNDAGTLEAIGMPDGLGTFEEGLLAHLSTVLQRTAHGGGAWTASEASPQGVRDVEYAWVEGVLERRAPEGLTRLVPGTVPGAVSGTVSGNLGALEHRETVARAAADGLPGGTATVAMTLTRQGAAAPLPTPKTAGWSWRAPEAPPSEAAVARTVDTGRLRGTSAEAWVTRLVTAFEGNDEPGAAAAFALLSLVRRHPETHASLVATCAAPTGACRPVLAALGAAGTPEAQGTLADLLEVGLGPANDPVVRARLAREVLRSLGTRLGAPPTDRTWAVLTSYVDDPVLGRQAAYGLGAAAARARRAGDIAGAEAAVARLRRMLDDPSTRRVGERALSNARRG